MRGFRQWISLARNPLSHAGHFQSLVIGHWSFDTKRSRRFKPLISLFALVWLIAPSPVLACATCFGASDSPLAEGMNWGILSLLGVVGFVLGGFVAFFVFLAKRAARVNAECGLRNIRS